MEDLTGKQFGPYQIVAPLGEGGMASVYKAYQPAMERYVALKVLPRHFAEDPQFTARFQREAKILAQLQHPYILPVFDSGQAEGYSYIVMPFVQSGTLTDLLMGQPLPLPLIRQIITQIGEALSYAHARGLIHRDVKPSNVLMDEGGNCLLADFGLARIVESSVNLTASGSLVGTPAYMSPEQGSGQKVDARSDIYALGVILYELVTGRVPYKAETPVAVIFKHIQDPLPSARELNPELPEAIERIILKALSKSPEDRYQTAGDMVHAIQAAISDVPSIPAKEPTLKHHRTETQDRALIASQKALPLWARVAIGLVTLSVIAGGLFAALGRESNPATQVPAQITAVTVMGTSTVAVASVPQAVEMTVLTPDSCAGATSIGARQRFTFEQIVPCLNTPQKLVDFMLTNLSFDPGWDNKTFGAFNVYSPAVEVYVNGADDCDGLAGFAACILSMNGYEAYNVGVSILGPSGHNVAGYIDRDGLKYSISNGQKVDGPFNTWEELAQFYIDSGIAAPPDGVIWLFHPCISNRTIGEAVLDLPHIVLR